MSNEPEGPDTLTKLRDALASIGEWYGRTATRELLPHATAAHEAAGALLDAGWPPDALRDIAAGAYARGRYGRRGDLIDGLRMWAATLDDHEAGKVLRVPDRFIVGWQYSITCADTVAAAVVQAELALRLPAAERSPLEAVADTPLTEADPPLLDARPSA